jgi:hypothetical protein
MFKTGKCQRKDGLIETKTQTSIMPHLNPFTCLREIQDPPPTPRWTTHVLNYQIAYLREQKRRKERRKSDNGSDNHRRNSPPTHIAQDVNQIQKNASISELSNVPSLRLQPQARQVGAALQEGSHLGVGTVPQSPSANAISLPVPDTSSLACLMNEELTSFTSANATSLTVPDTASLMKGGLTPLTSANAISLTIPDQLQEKHMEGGLTPLTSNEYVNPTTKRHLH